ncbi:MAG: hypothetical protein ABIQ52_03535, partial [Vicinamibacterales bacterium]
YCGRSHIVDRQHGGMGEASRTLPHPPAEWKRSVARADETEAEADRIRELLITRAGTSHGIPDEIGAANGSGASNDDS